jgi:gliding motility-associated-like protein
MSLTRMIGKPYSVWLAVALLLGVNTVQAQLNANFIPNKSGGCSPLAVVFVNTTTGASPAAIYSWNFGNGNVITTTDAVTPVAATYSVGQSYTVTLTVNDGGNSSSISSVINVYKTPTVDFSFSNNSGCQPLTSTFSAAATPGDGYITSYFWDFGDGHTLNTTSSTVSNIYNFAGTYSVNVTVTNSFGCTGTIQKKNIVTVMPGVTAGFFADSTTLCSLADPVSFTNTTTGVGAITYSWSFGDGTTSTSPNPSHQYSTKGTYTIQLTATSAQGCTNTVVRSAYIHAADFTPDFNTPPPLCSGSGVTFSDFSTPPSSNTLWDFGDGQIATGNSVNHLYALGGNYNVTMTGTYGGCLASIQKPVTVSTSPVLPGFVIDYGLACQAPMTVNFIDTSLGAVKWHWNFTGNPGDTSNLQNPSFFYSTQAVYNPTLTITDANGCTATISETLNSKQKTAAIKMDTVLHASATICATVTATFSAITKDTIATFNWDFGDGTTSTAANPVHDFNTPGTYIINLSFTTNHGCIGTAFPPDTVIVYPKPHAIFTALDSLPCASNQTELFTNLDDSAARFFWIYGDGSSDVNNNILHTHTYGLPGSYTMTLVASSPGCAPDTATLTKYVVAVPTPDLTATNTCDTTRTVVTFTDTTASASKYIWDFGDGTIDSSNVFVGMRYHDYTNPGIYTASLTGVFGACQATVTVPVYVLKPQHPLLSASLDSICENAQLAVQIAGLDTNYQSIARGSGTYYNIVSWQYNDGSIFSPQGNSGFKTTFSKNITNLKPGMDSLRVIVKSRFFNCLDTSNFIPIHIMGPVAGFFVQDNTCYTKPVIFTDTSKATDGVPIVLWSWDMGDGTTIVRTNNDTVMHAYAFPGNYNAKLTVTDSNGCVGVAKLAASSVVVNGPKADFYWSPPGVILGNPVTFHNASTTGAGISYQWKFSSDGFTSNAPDSLQRTYLTPVNDTIWLVASGIAPGSCSDTTMQVLIVPKTTASFTYTTDYIDNANCPPMVAYFQSQTVNATSLHWDFGDGSTADNNPAPSHTYTRPGVYLVSLTAYGPGGQSATSEDSITVKGPFAVLHADLLQACIPALETLHATSSGVYSYIWDYGDGTLLGTTDTISHHTYVIPGIFTPNLVITDSTGCQVNFGSNDKIIMDSLHVQIPPDTVLCNPAIISFVPKIYSMARDTLNEVLAMHWNFGTGNPADTSNATEPVFNFTGRGQFPVSLQVQSPPGCSVTVRDTVNIASPFNMQPDSAEICPGGHANLQVQGADIYNWLPDLTLSNIRAGTAVASPRVYTTYTVIGHDKYFCFTDTAIIPVKMLPVPTVTAEPLITVPAGTSLVLNTQASADVISWSWSPSGYLSCTNCPTPTTLPQAPISYIVTVTNASGCTATDTVVIRLTCSEKSVYVPNAFTPNDDGNNDFFFPIGKGAKLIKYFQVYSRWGELLFSKTDIPANDKNYGWNGTLNGTKQPPGTYVYVVGVECYTGETFMLKGTVELLR